MIDQRLITSLNFLGHAVFVHDRYAAMAVTRIVMSPIAVTVAVMVSYADANGPDADVRVLSMCRNRDRDACGR
jgi:hypothetical protein